MSSLPPLRLFVHLKLRSSNGIMHCFQKLAWPIHLFLSFCVVHSRLRTNLCGILLPRCLSLGSLLLIATLTLALSATNYELEPDLFKPAKWWEWTCKHELEHTLNTITHKEESTSAKKNSNSPCKPGSILTRDVRSDFTGMEFFVLLALSCNPPS